MPRTPVDIRSVGDQDGVPEQMDIPFDRVWEMAMIARRHDSAIPLATALFNAAEEYALTFRALREGKTQGATLPPTDHPEQHDPRGREFGWRPGYQTESTECVSVYWRFPHSDSEHVEVQFARFTKRLD